MPEIPEMRTRIMVPTTRLVWLGGAATLLSCFALIDWSMRWPAFIFDS
ncbi:MAG: hypothetical protein ACI8W8_004416, partial [Rhodothermales bacterium]